MSNHPHRRRRRCDRHDDEIAYRITDLPRCLAEIGDPATDDAAAHVYAALVIAWSPGIPVTVDALVDWCRRLHRVWRDADLEPGACFADMLDAAANGELDREVG